MVFLVMPQSSPTLCTEGGERERERELTWKWNWKSLLRKHGKDEGMDEKKCDETKTIFSFVCVFL
jgi:hypothetical protein